MTVERGVLVFLNLNRSRGTGVMILIILVAASLVMMIPSSIPRSTEEIVISDVAAVITEIEVDGTLYQDNLCSSTGNLGVIYSKGYTQSKQQS